MANHPIFCENVSVLNLVYLLALLLLLPWVAWRRFFSGRPVATPWLRFTGRVLCINRVAGVKRIWLHGVSVGEVHLLAVLAAEITAQAHAAGIAVECVISSSTTTGLELASRRFGVDRAFPCPLDFTWAVNNVLACVSPDMLVLGELELWPTLLACTHAQGIPIVVANARMSEKSARGYARISPLVSRMLGRVSLVLARSQADADRFRARGAPAVIVTGSMKFDVAQRDCSQADIDRLKRLADITARDIVFLAGSTQAPEEQLAIDAFCALQQEYPALRLLIVPRHVERCGEISSLLNRSGFRWELRSHLPDESKAEPLRTTSTQDGSGNHGSGNPGNSRLHSSQHEPSRVLLVDTTGELTHWWGTATIAFVGGSLDGKRGGQNMLEPASYGAAVAFGPHTRNFQDEVRRLLEARAAEVVADGPAMLAFVAHCLREPAWANGLGQRAAALVAAQRGATASTAKLILQRLFSPPG